MTMEASRCGQREERVALIDADIFAYQAAVVVEHNIQWSDWHWTRHCDFGEAVKVFEDRIYEIVEDLVVDRPVMVLSDPLNWRKSIMPEYKYHRKKTPKPVCFAAMREYIADMYETWQRPTLEGDE